MKVSIQAACRIALPLYTREVYHRIAGKTIHFYPKTALIIDSSKSINRLFRTIVSLFLILRQFTQLRVQRLQV